MTSGGVVLVLDALAARFGGTASFAVQLVRALLERQDVARVVVLAERDSVALRELEASGRLRLIHLDVPAHGRVPWRVGWEAARLPSLVAAEGADALLSFSGMVPRHPPCRIIALVSNPGPYLQPWRIGNVVRRHAIARTARRAHRLYVPSRAMAEMMGAPGAKVV